MTTTTDDPSQSTTTIPSSLTCISVLTYTVKVVKSGRLRFEYRYRIPADLSTLLFSFHYRLYANGGIFEGDGPGGQLARRYPMPTVEQQSFEVNEVTFDRPGLYVFTWRSVSVGHPRGGGGGAGRFEQLNAQNNNNNNNNLFKESSSALFSLGFIRLRRILVEGIAYASECTPCPPGTFAPTIRSRTCSACPPNTANEGAGAAACARCDPATEYAPRGSVRCRKRPQCGLNDFYTVPVGVCNATTRQQKVQYRWIEPRICIDSKGVFPKGGEGVVNCTSSTSSSSSSTSCDLGMELQEDPKAPSSAGNHSTKFCQFCPEGSYRGDYSSPACAPCPPFTSPYYALSVFRWNSSLPSWSASSLEEQEEYFAENSRYLNAYFSRLCIHTDEEDNSGGGGNDAMDVSRQGTEDGPEDSSSSSNSRVEECDSRNTWQPYADHIRTGASSMLDSYLIFSVAVPGFRSNAGGELSFVFETFCDAGDSCVLMFVETRADEGELADLVSRQLTKGSSTTFVKTSSAGDSSSAISRSKYLFLHSSNHVLKEWYQSTEGGRLSYRHRVEGGGGGGNVSGANLIYSWVFKRSTSFQSYAKVYSLLLTNSMAGSAVQCKSCPTMSSTALSSSSSSSSSNQCVTCPEGQYLEDGEEDGQVVKDGHSSTVVRSEGSLSSHPQCRHCPENYVVNQSLALPIGRRSSCLPCGPGLGTAAIQNQQQQNSKPVCFSNCSVAFADGARYELGELGSELEYRGGSMFTAGGTQFLHLFRIGLCGHPRTAKLVTCQNNITDMYEQQQDKDQSSASSSGGGIRAFICRSTIIPDSPGVIYTTQSFSLGKWSLHQILPFSH